MSTSDPANSQNGQPDKAMQVSDFDQVSSLLMALLLFVGFAVFFMFLIWLCDQLDFRGGEVVVAIVEEAAGRGENPEGFERDFEPPGAEETEELDEPTLTDTLQAVTDAVSTVAASLDSFATEAAATTSGTGQGDSRPPGPEGEGDDIIPRFERWRLKFAAKSKGAYATQLDFYKIELGAVGGSKQGVDYAYNLGSSPKKRHNPNSGDEKRLYFRFTSASQLKRWDAALLSQAGVSTIGRYQMKFIPPNLENKLAQIEKDYYEKAGYESVSFVARTVFESREAGSGYEFVVIDQSYRKPGKAR